MDNIYRISAGSLSAAIEKTKSGVRLYSLRDRRTSKSLLTASSPLFTLTAAEIGSDDTELIESDSGWKDVSVSVNGNTTVISLSGSEKVPGLSVTLTAAADTDRITWAVSITCTGCKKSLISCDYPVLSFDTGDNVKFFYPYGSGEVYDTPRKSGLQNAQNYPSYGVSMQYMAFWNSRTGRGIYYGLHDGAPAYKRLSFLKKAGDRHMSMRASQPLAEPDRAGTSQQLCGNCVWQIFDGDWYDAAMIYRAWALERAEFLPGREKLPEWYRRNPHWFLVHIGEDDSFADEVIEAAKILGTDTAVHLYLWHQNPFDNDYPHYFPVRDCAKTGLKKLHDAGIKVMPYINGRLWDTRDRGLEDFEFTSVAKANATSDRHGVCFTESYSSRETDGSKVSLAIMCPSTALWQEKMAYTVGRLINEEGFDGVYMDQIAAAQPYPCCNRNHPHRSGGGDWWCRSYRALLDRVYREIPEGSLLTTECTADPFISHMGGYLSWLWIRDRQVPAFPAVYSDQIPLFGRCYNADTDPDDNGMRIFLAQSLVYGEQMGWIPPKRFIECPYRDFYVSCVKLRADKREYFDSASMLRPPVITCGLPRLRTESDSQAINRICEENAVIGGMWRKRGGGKALFIVNASKEDAAVTVSSGDIPDGSYTICGADAVFSGGKAEFVMPALSCGCIEFPG